MKKTSKKPVMQLAPEIDLDLSLDSLKHIDGVLDALGQKKKEPQPETMFVLGHYVGEVLSLPSPRC